MTKKNKEVEVKEEEKVTFPLSDDERMVANKKLSVLVTNARAALSEAEKFADKYHLDFYWQPAYGMGGFYNGNPDERGEDDEGGWSSSSSGC